ncbi:hypothetical protein Lade_0536 [Legionella adelaidensis]|uniref:UPF0250 protein Lade_0536 n=1 Tax=Legionella adelaidensis TaxID=45056 RepID=A0A0W0R482_9GAMM|nr:DUF493 domain-containing protein [Legionella adelaidensis]KTC65878.1 hypothetical protein Lade_0536 [Legionella adelaidensis]
MTDTPSLIEFPCDFQIKIIGTNHAQFVEEILALAKKHFADVNTTSIKTNVSKNSNYLSITLTVHALNKPSLDALYRDLTSHPDVKMVL